ncbi:MAG TPA: MBL fold metallo-hydrolase [Pyrinomonadaceae bacterium]|nr:MBL fold metallo-hydrolase [Pyrinomonadaceae bacterium]
MRFTLLGVGAMNSPRYAPAGLLVEQGRSRAIIDGGLLAKARITAWLVTDERSELNREIRKLAHVQGLEPHVAAFRSDDLIIEPRPVVHTSHPTFGYLIRSCGRKIVWAPEFLDFPPWARGADLMFAEAAGWTRSILFRGGVGGHACVEQVARDAEKYKVKKLVFAHIGRPTIKAINAGQRPSFGEYGADGDIYSLRSDGSFFRRALTKR